MSDKNVSELLNMVEAGASLSLRAEHYSVDDIIPLAAACGKSQVRLELRGALDWRTHDLVELARIGEGMLVFSDAT